MPFDLQPTLKGELLALRPLRPEDSPDLYAVASDPLIWEQHPSKDRYQEEVFQRFFREALASGGALLAITKKGSGVFSESFRSISLRCPKRLPTPFSNAAPNLQATLRSVSYFLAAWMSGCYRAGGACYSLFLGMTCFSPRCP